MDNLCHFHTLHMSTIFPNKILVRNRNICVTTLETMGDEVSQVLKGMLSNKKDMSKLPQKFQKPPALL